MLPENRMIEPEAAVRTFTKTLRSVCGAVLFGLILLGLLGLL